MNEVSHLACCRFAGMLLRGICRMKCLPPLMTALNGVVGECICVYVYIWLATQTETGGRQRAKQGLLSIVIQTKNNT